MFQIEKGSVKKKRKKEGVSIYLKYSLNIQEESTLGLSLRVAQRQENQAGLPSFDICYRDSFRAF